MRKLTFLTAGILLATWTYILPASGQSAKKELIQHANQALDLAARQYKLMAQHVPDTLLPRSTNKDGSLMTSNSRWWCSGFFSWHFIIPV